MKRLMIFLALVGGFTVAVTVASAQTAPMDDGPWIDLPPGTVIDTSYPSQADIVAMADLDGNPDVTTEDEQRMIALLMQLLYTAPIGD